MQEAKERDLSWISVMICHERMMMVGTLMDQKVVAGTLSGAKDGGRGSGRGPKDGRHSGRGRRMVVGTPFKSPLISLHLGRITGQDGTACVYSF